MDNQLRTLLMTAYGQASAFNLLDHEGDLHEQIIAARDTGDALCRNIMAIRNRIVELDYKRQGGPL